MEKSFSTKITVVNENGRYEVEIPAIHLSFLDILEQMEAVFLAMGYQEATIREYIDKE